MSKRETDISQIRKYLKGELDAKAMHLLERRAQHDPFLMDALEGYEMTGSDQQANLDDLGGRLKQRTEQKKGKIVPLWLISAAASVLIIFSVSTWWYYQNQSHEKALSRVQVANIVKPATQVSPTEKMASIAEKPQPEPKIAKKTKSQAAQPGPTVLVNNSVSKSRHVLREITVTKPAADTVAADRPNDEMVGYSAKKVKDTSLKIAALKEITIKRKDTGSLNHLLQSKVAGVNVQNNNAQKHASLNELMIHGNLGGLQLNQLLANQIITGRVTDETDKLPIPGADVKIAGTDKTTKTDADGRFQINADSGKATLVIAGKGYAARRVSANNRDSVKNIALEPGNSALSEEIVTGYTSQKKDDEAVANIYAHPQKGWSDFRKYLRKNAVSPDGKTGAVNLSFTVDKNGSVSDIKIIKGLSEASDKKAISLVKDGPDWVGNSNKQPEKIHVRIRFTKK